jgi:hypothetical protein
MAMNLQMDTSDLERVERPLPRLAPPLDLQPQKSPFYIGQLPTTANVNPDAVRNFATPGIPSYRITPAAPLNVAGSVVNAVAPVTVAPQLLQPVPAPTISSPLATIPTGYQFSFLQVRLTLGSTSAISTYKIYRGPSNDTSSAAVIRSIPHHPANVGVPVVVQDSQPNGVTQFYFVSAVNTNGVESTLTPAQSGAVSNNAGFNSKSQVASSFHNTPVNASFIPLSTTTLSNDGVNTIINIAASTLQFGSGQVSYNSGSANFGGFGTFYIFVDDPTFSGGAVTYLLGTLPGFGLLSDVRLPFGKIQTSTIAGATTGGGTSGGTTQTSSPPVPVVGGRGLLL